MLSKVFRLVGSPASAVVVNLPAERKVNVGYAAVVLTKDRLDVSRASRISAINGPAELVLSGEQSPTIVDVAEQWKVDPRRLLAWTATSQSTNGSLTMSGPGEMVLSSHDGIFRVDVRPGSRFVVDPHRVVAHTGLGGRTVYRESRLDTLAAWTGWLFDGLKRSVYWSSRGLEALYRGVFAVAHFLEKLRPAHKALPPGDLKKALPQEPLSAKDVTAKASSKAESLAAKASLSAQAETRPAKAESLAGKEDVPSVIDIPKPSNAHKVLNTLKHWQAIGADKTFYYTHPPKLEFKGPCSILIT